MVARWIAPNPACKTCRGRGRCPRKPLPAVRARGRGVFHGIAACGVAGWRLFLLFKVFFFFPSSLLGFHRPFRGCSAFFGWLSFAAASAFSLLPLSEGRFHHRLAVFIASFLGAQTSIKSA